MHTHCQLNFSFFPFFVFFYFPLHFMYIHLFIAMQNRYIDVPLL